MSRSATSRYAVEAIAKDDALQAARQRRQKQTVLSVDDAIACTAGATNQRWSKTKMLRARMAEWRNGNEPGRAQARQMMFCKGPFYVFKVASKNKLYVGDLRD